MYCTNCGKTIDANAAVCPACGAAQPVGAPAGPVPNHLAGAILATLFCCWPFGIPAIVYAAKVNGKLVAGDFAGARDASSRAKNWMTVSIVLGALFWTIEALVILIPNIVKARGGG